MSAPETWLVTGAAGFIGSHLVEALLHAGHTVRGLDNFTAGKPANLAPFRSRRAFTFVEGDIRDGAICRQAAAGVSVVLHQAALGSVPRSLEDPATTHDVNVTGFVNMLLAARDAGVRRFVYASSSAVYGDAADSPKTEARLGHPLSPYAATKLANEIYAGTFARCYGLETIGLRYFNVFGPRQDPAGAYAAVIPAWISALLRGQPVQINGDGETSRDFCYVANVVQANLAAGAVRAPEAVNQIYNVAVGAPTSLNELYALLREKLTPRFPRLAAAPPVHGPFRAADVRHSLADISKARRLLGYEPSHTLAQGLDAALNWYIEML
ncbi:MAG TPA: SDR family oxidoreductase [Verrucomicrobiae bacterium]|jgi:UDP-N-acetylglucosamine 4-epimerase|nr:SDR family oxidoreductase [Verrucomicrobiae bacterium]